MNSALNVEYVYLIIFGVSNLYDQTKSNISQIDIKKKGKDIEISYNHINGKDFKLLDQTDRSLTNEIELK